MRCLIACESSGRVREAFRKKGHDAWSCDLKPAEDNSPYHHTGDVLDFIRTSKPFDLIIAHPPCTYLCNSGVRWLYKEGAKQLDRETGEPNWDAKRFASMEDALDFWQALEIVAVSSNKDIKLAFENPIQHALAAANLGRPNQYVQPWWFGDPAFKATGLWLRNLDPLVPTNKLTPPKPGTPEHKAWSVIHRASPGPNRGEERSRTFPGIAKAMADQWG